MKPVISEDFHRYCSLNNEISECYHNASTRLGLSDSIMQILYVISLEGDGCLIRDIIRYTGLSKQTVNSALRAMERDGYLQLAAADGKKKTAILTESGKELAENTAKKMIRAEVAVFDAWAPEDRSAYLELTKRFLSDLEVQFHKL